MKRLILLSGLLLAGCGGGGERPEPEIRTVEVRVPVPVPCQATQQLGAPPAYPDTGPAITAAANLFERVRLLLAGRELRIARNDALEAAVQACGR
jgi:hypothetical protein